MSGYPAGRFGDRGDREIVYVPNVYVPYLAPRDRSLRISAENLPLQTQILSSTPRCGSGPKCRLEAPPPPPPCALGPLPPTSLGRTLPEPCKKSQGGWGEEGRRGRGGKGFGLREGSSDYNRGWGGPSKHQLGPDPHLGAPNSLLNSS